MRRFSHRLNSATTSFILLILCFSTLFGQGFHFGRNKVQYTHFDWQIMETTHFDIYFYPEMKDIAEIGARFAEDSYSYLETKFNHSVNRRIPLIFYSTHLFFQQTNITPGFIPEGVGGFFEFIKGRVVLPSNGDLKQFKRVIQHELVHVFMHSKINNVYASHDQIDGAYPPLWFVEGLAEYWSGAKWDAKAEMVLKDAVLNNYVVGLVEMRRIYGTFTMYKIGQDIVGYIAKEYGEDKLLKLLEVLWKYNYFEQCFQDILGVSYREFDKHYLYHLKKRYYPLLAREDFNDQVSETVVRDGYNFKPAYFKMDGQEYIAFVGNRTGYSSIFMKPLRPMRIDEEEEVETLLQGESSSDFEAFHIFDSKIDVNADGQLVFTSKSGETDALYIYDIRQRRVIAKHYFDRLVGLFSPSWSADGKEIVFSGLDVSGYKDIYIFRPQEEELIQLTDDFYNDENPVFSPDGNFIAFSSDRTDYGPQGAQNIFLLNRNSGDIFYLTFGNQSDQSPVFSPDGRYLAYTSDKTGTYNIFIINKPLQAVLKQEPIKTYQMTRYVGTTFDPEWTETGGLLFGTFESGRFQIRLDPDFLQKQDKAQIIATTHIPILEEHWSFAKIDASRVRGFHPYQRNYTLDFAQGQVLQDPVFGTTGGAQFVFTDMLGNDQYYVLVYNNARTTSDFWKSFNLGLTKVSLGDRLNYSYGVFRFAGFYYNPQDLYYYEERVGGNFVFSYPLSQFTRVSLNQSFSYSDKDWLIDKSRIAYLNSSFVSFVHDNSLWGPTGPMDGGRFNITLGNTYDFVFSRVNYFTVFVDLRQYFRLSQRSAYAVRLFTLYNQGKEARQYYFGGSWDLRLYPRWSMHGERLFLISQELRFPLIDLIGIRFPFGSFGLQGIRGALFVDAGNAWNDVWTGIKGSFGLGIRLNLGGALVLRWDIGRLTDFRRISNNTITQFFFGWDF
ncbi:MAG TPA: hypothetical protein ENK44_07340 [Caldithrix abyssi]|uniref:Bacterial surface antigen (D15) domain-containing protein n=1 Tax=Caldithrix abyssi TaxID=187145 RepID=A0A7V4TZZ5_CALAY|nr:hypothetical protein [Caldithrix abyssi]